MEDPQSWNYAFEYDIVLLSIYANLDACKKIQHFVAEIVVVQVWVLPTLDDFLEIEVFAKLHLNDHLDALEIDAILQELVVVEPIKVITLFNIFFLRGHLLKQLFVPVDSVDQVLGHFEPNSKIPDDVGVVLYSRQRINLVVFLVIVDLLEDVVILTQFYRKFYLL